MGFEVVQSPHRPIWMPVDYNDTTANTLYLGQLVVAGYTASCSGGVKGWTQAGIADTTADQVPYGVVVGTNNAVPVYNSDGIEYITSVTSQANLLARDSRGVEGKMYRNDPQAMVQVMKLTPEVTLKGRIFNAAWGVAPNVLTVTTGDAEGDAFVSNTTEHTPVAYNAAVACRTGANRGLYRTTYDTSGTTRTVHMNFPHDIAIGDTFVGVNLSTGGCCATYFDDAGMFIDNSAAVQTTNYIWVDVDELSLMEAGKEYAIFRINAVQYNAARA